MNAKEAAFYKAIRNLDSDRVLAASKVAIDALAKSAFDKRVASLRERIARNEVSYKSLRSTFPSDGRRPADARAGQAPRQFNPLHAPKVPRLREPQMRFGSWHLVDVPPFLNLTSQNVNIFTGATAPPANQVAVSADASGGISFIIAAGDGAGTFITGVGPSPPIDYFQNNSAASCSASVGQAYVVPVGVLAGQQAVVRFSASVSFSWTAFWDSEWWRLASGDVWIGMVVNRFDSNLTWVDNPVNFQTMLQTWSDENIGDDQAPGGSSSGLELACSALVEPGFIYNCWVCIGADVFGQMEVSTGSSFSQAAMTANVGSLVFDTSVCPEPF
jgi:hypothetical protein